MAARAILGGGGGIDLVLSDVILPGGVSGLEFAEELRLSMPELPVIFMSGYPAESATRGDLYRAAMSSIIAARQARPRARA